MSLVITESQTIVQECPICMDHINPVSNCVHTECGHVFHTSCLMRNVSHNGFGCPYCRTVMAEVVSDDESEYSERSYADEERYGDDVLRGLRLFMNNIEGEQQSPEDIAEETEALEAEAADFVAPTPKPSSAYIAQKLVEQGLTMESLVKVLLAEHDEYDQEEDEYLELGDDIFGRMRIIISNYSEPNV